MTVELTADEKINILTSHQKNIVFNQYNISVNLMEEQARTTPDSSLITNYQNQISEMTNQINVLQTTIDALMPQALKQ